MGPRFSARKLCLIITISACTWIVLLLLHQQQNQFFLMESTSQQNLIIVEDIKVELEPSLKQVTSTSTPPLITKKIKERFEKSWFFVGGTKKYLKSGTIESRKLFPSIDSDDRIIEQLMYIPSGYDEENTIEKLILVYNGLGAFNQPSGNSAFEECPVKKCTLSDNASNANIADALLFRDHVSYPAVKRPKNQIWILYHLECPLHTKPILMSDSINWTATYRRDSDLVTPYERWAYYNPKIRQRVQTVDYAANKTKKVAWFVSNCGARNNRAKYAEQLKNYIDVDIYGGCGPFKCPRTDSNTCFQLLDNDYKFYLAFENSNCRHYITEKLYVNGLGHNVLPIVMGATREDYRKTTPERSFIHVDDFNSARELAAYLHELDNDNDLYNSYFKWKGTGEFINTYFWCRLCAMLHSQTSSSDNIRNSTTIETFWAGDRYYEDVNNWWRGPGICVNHK